MRFMTFGMMVLAVGMAGPSSARAQPPIIAEVETVDSGPRARTTRMEVLSNGRFLRMNMTGRRGEQSSVIRGPAPETLMVSHSDRTVVMMPAPQPAAGTPPRVERSRDTSSAGSSTACRYRRWRLTGNTETISGFVSTELQVLDGTRVCATFWTSTAAPFGLFEVYERMGTLMSGAARGMSPLTPMFARARALGRFPQDSVIRYSAEGSNEVTTLLRAAVSPVPAASEFVAPAGYTVRRMPGMGSGGMPPGMMPSVRIPAGAPGRTAPP